MKFPFALAVIAAACGQLLFAQQQAPLPTFRTSVEAVQVDAVVIDADGNVVTNLTADDFEVIENRVPRPITAFTLVDIPLDPPLGPLAGWPVRPDVLSNDGPAGRVYLFGLDPTMPTHLAMRVRLFVRWFLEDHFRPNDIGAVAVMGRGLVTDGQDFTGDPHLLLAAADRFMGTAPEDRPRTLGHDVSGLDKLESLRHLTEVLAAAPGGRKAFLYFTGHPGFNPFGINRLAPSRLALRFGSEDALDALSAATRGSVLIYPIDPAGLTPELESLDTRMDRVAFANLTGAFAVVDSNDFRGAFERIVRDHSVYYVLGFDSSYTGGEGRLVPVEVRVKRPGLRVQAREGYVAPVGRPPHLPDASATAAIAALRHPFATPGVPVRVFAAPYKGAAGRDAAVALVVEVDTARLDFAAGDAGATADLEITYTPVDARKRAHPGGRHAISLVVPPDAPAWESTVRLVSQLALPEGRYQLRVAAGSGTQSGSVVYDLEVPDFGRRPLMLSGVSITSTVAGAVPTFRPEAARDAGRSRRCNPPSCEVPLADGAPSGEDPLRGALSRPATAAREFDREEAVTLFAEVYENLPPRTPAHTIRFTTSLRDEDGAVREMTSETRASTGARRPSGGFGFTAAIPLDDVPPGDYVLMIDAWSDAEGGATASRAVPIAVR